MSLKDSILIELEKSRTEDISGQALAEKFGVSRNAVWKAVKALKEEGYEISSSTNRGYRLSPDCDRLARESVRELLDSKEIPIYTFDSLDSTNSEAKRMLAQNKTGSFLVLAEEQTGGCGRKGRKFFSPRQAGLYMTLVLKPEAMDMREALGVTSYAAVCVVEAIECITGKKCGIKWVNDIFFEGKKICGILTEAISDFESGSVGALIIGIGINLRRCEVPEQLKDIMGALDCRESVKNRLAADITNRLLRYKAGETEYIGRYKRCSLVLGRELKYYLNNTEYTGIAVDIDSGGALIVKRDDGTLDTLTSGEISVRLKTNLRD